MTARNTLFNLLGLGTPLVVAVVAIPELIETLGTARFGLLTLIWAVVSYVGLFDLGLGRTMTLQLAAIECSPDRTRIAPTITTALTVMGGLGLATGVILFLFADVVVGAFSPEEYRVEAIAAARAMGIGVPAIVLTSGLRGILEARHAFGLVNLIRIPVGVFTYLAPLAVVWFGSVRLDDVAWALVAGRYAALVAHAVPVARRLPRDAGVYRFRTGYLRGLLTSGGWLTLSGVVSPAMAYLDRFVIAGLVSASAVTYYATPHEVVARLAIIPGALTSVLLPTFVSRLRSGGSSAQRLFDRSVTLLACALLPLCVGLAVFAEEILSIWIGPGFAEQSAPLLRVFAIGAFLGSIAPVPYTLIQSAGRPRTTATIHLLEAVPFLLLLWGLTSSYGTLGAASAWLIRVVVDTGVLFWSAAALLGRRPLRFFGMRTLAYAAAVAAAFSGALVDSVVLRSLWFCVVTIAAATHGFAARRQRPPRS